MIIIEEQFFHGMFWGFVIFMLVVLTFVAGRSLQ